MKLYISQGGGASLLGRDWLSKLGINVTNGTMGNETSDGSLKNNINPNFIIKDLISEFSSVSKKGLDKLHNFKAKLYLKQDAIPVFYKACPLPFSMKIKAEQELERDGILSPINHSDWASAIVPVIKKMDKSEFVVNFNSLSIKILHTEISNP